MESEPLGTKACVECSSQALIIHLPGIAECMDCGHYGWTVKYV